ncbi:MAG: chromosome segregation protein SMC [Acidobacteria bacterium RIFCSPLOWO2_02_FULL_61_28]|nr:MAG: chromosome segregation protein SMC [Acidobacteria bacterium RIFCSPLOWO2_02_FULL_61_28]
MLKLQKIELLGFKSFADRTEITFNGEGVAAVVGPNGCGKSNISDAISWVLGEQSPKSLRSGRMQDVIFSGTPTRKATGLAEVRLTMLDPEIEFAPAIVRDDATPQNGDHGYRAAARSGEIPGVITVARRLFLSGESEYILNGRPCRLRDIQEIFLGTGLGPDCYAIIEQGRIGQILSAKSYERRALIEEAAGVTKFKARRKLAWAKLESSKQNLARVNDIFEEIKRQVNSLQRQAARARRYRELLEQMRAQLRLVLSNRYRDREQEAVQAALELGLLQNSLAELLARIAGREGEQQQLHQQLEREEAELRHAMEERSQLRVTAERARSQAASQAQQIGYLDARIAEGRTEEVQLGEQVASLTQQRDQSGHLLDELWRTIETLAGQVHDFENQARGCQEESKEKERRLAQLRGEMLETVQECAALRNQAGQLEQFLAATARQIEQTESQRAAAGSARSAASARQEESQARLKQRQEGLVRLSDERRSWEQSLRETREEESQLRVQLEGLRSELSAERARQVSLEEILSHRAYGSETVQRLFELHTARKNGNGSNGHVATNSGQTIPETASACFDPAGVLADFVEVDPAHERVVEEFLREELAYIVVEDWLAASEGVRLLQSEVSGRATFLLHAHPMARGNGHGVAQLPAAHPGVLNSLASCLRFTNGLSEAADALLPKLQRSYLVADTEAGRSLAEAHPELYFLTPQGEWFHGSTVTAGQTGPSGPLTLKRELRELARTVAEREAAMARTSESLAYVTSLITEQEAIVHRLTREQQEAEKSTLVAERDVKEAADELERVTERASLLGFEAERLRHESERARDRLSQDTQGIAEREQRRAAMEAETAAVSQAVTDLEAIREATQTRAAEFRSRLAVLQERHRAGREAFEGMQRNTEELAARAAGIGQQCEEWNRQKAAYAEDNRRLEQDAAAAEERSEALMLCMAELEQSCAQCRSRLGGIDQEVQRLRQELEELRNQKTALEVRMARLESELAHLKESCRNDLGVEIETLLAEDLQALAPEALAGAEEQYRQIKTRIENLGPINMMALEEYEECKQRHDFLAAQQQDLIDSIHDTTKAIQEIDAVTQKQFSEAFTAINANFQETFRRLFGGGQGFLRMTESEDPAEAGIEIVAQPPGKRLQNVLLLSGGEKALTALALLVAIFRHKPSPFCVLDEVDAPLDEANIGRFTQLVEEMSRTTQFILITHSKRTMNIAPVLYGVTMEEPGVSKIVSVRFNAPAVAESVAEAAA